MNELFNLKKKKFVLKIFRFLCFCVKFGILGNINKE